MMSWLLIAVALAKPRPDRPAEPPVEPAAPAEVAPDDGPEDVEPTPPPADVDALDQDDPIPPAAPGDPAVDAPAEPITPAAPPPRPPPPVVFPDVPRAEPPPDVSPVTPPPAPEAAPPPMADEGLAEASAPPEAAAPPPGRAADLRPSSWLPRLPQLHPATAAAWLVLAALLWSLSRKVRAAAAALPEDAPAAQLARLTGRVSRAITVGLLLLLGAATLPSGLAPVLGWAVLGAALALGWSAQEVLRDVVAGLGVGGERGLAPGAWVEGPGFSGTVTRRGLRATTLRAADGSRIVVPHRALAAATLASRPAGGPPCRVVVDLPAGTSPARVRRAVRRALAGSPWVAHGDAPPSAAPLPDGRWEITAPVLSPRWASDLMATLPERVRSELAADHAAP